MERGICSALTRQPAFQPCDSVADLCPCQLFKSTDSRCAIMDQDESRGLLKSILGIFARKPPEKSAPPASVRSQAFDAWLRTDAYLQHETDEFDEIDPENLARTLSAFEDLVQHDPDRGPD